MRTRFGCALAAALLVLTGSIAQRPAGADTISLPTPGSGDWRPLAFRGIANRTHYSIETLDGAQVTRAVSNCGASGLVLPLGAIQIDQTPLLSWRWRVDRGLELDAEQSKAGDDFAARVYILFEFDPSRATGLQRLGHRLAKFFYGEDIPGSALNFVWTSRLPAGTLWDNPFESSAKMIALASGSTGGWRRETVDVIARYREFFDAPIPPLRGLAIMSDSDNSCQRTEAHFADFKFMSSTEADGRDAD